MCVFFLNLFPYFSQKDDGSPALAANANHDDAAEFKSSKGSGVVARTSSSKKAKVSSSFSGKTFAAQAKSAPTTPSPTLAPASGNSGASGEDSGLLGQRGNLEMRAFQEFRVRKQNFETLNVS